MPIRRDDRGRYVEVEPRRAEETSWLRCRACGELVFRRKLKETNHICPRCGAYFFLTAQERIASLVDPDTYTPLGLGCTSTDPLEFVDRRPYHERLEEAQAITELKDAILVGRGSLDGCPLMLGVIDFRFIGGSMGQVVGDEIATALEQCAAEGIPFVLVVASGGARVQEGVVSLMQMAKTVATRNLLAEAGVPFIAVLTYPSSGGMLASVASLADVTVAEQGAMIGFAGPRVIEQTTGERLPAGFQTASFALEHGMVDQVVTRELLRAELAKALHVLAGGAHG
ncbi:MAG: acetyl-CoA carboxylase carboxyltransferase subunit beta [Candidatus Bipolaricaulota bacterium]